MPLAITQTKTAVAAGIKAYFLASGGVGPYTYAIIAGGAGGTINASSGLYTAPASLPTDPTGGYDTIQVTDSTPTTHLMATAKILVAGPLFLLRELLMKGMGITDETRCYFWDQKALKPSDNGLWILLTVPSLKTIANTLRPGTTGWNLAEQSVTLNAMVDINVISRDTSALVRAPEVLMALQSPYAQAQQETNSFQISRIPTEFNDLSSIDGAAIPYRYHITVRMNYAMVLPVSPDYFDTFQDVALTVEQ